jgi:hypothetical protein
MRISQHYIIVLSAAAVLLSSCGSETEVENSGNMQDSSKTGHDTVTITTTRNFFHSLPSPLAMAAVYSNTGLKYVEGLALDPGKVGNFTTLKDKAINLGIYSADMAYNLVNNQQQNCIKYLDAIKTLSDGVDLGSVFQANDYIDRFKRNLSRRDSLAMVFSELKQEMDCFMDDNHKENIALFIFSGAWIESIYIASQSVKSKQNDAVFRTIAEQKYILDNLMGLMTDYETEPNFKDLFLGLSDLKSSFEKLTTMVGDEVTMSNINERNIKEITDKISTFRNKLCGL